MGSIMTEEEENEGAAPMEGGPSLRAKAAFALGLISYCLVLGFFSGIPACLLAQSELEAIAEGRAPAAGRRLARAGFWLGLSASVLFALIFLWLLFIIFVSRGV